MPAVASLGEQQVESLGQMGEQVVRHAGGQRAEVCARLLRARRAGTLRVESARTVAQRRADACVHRAAKLVRRAGPHLVEGGQDQVEQDLAREGCGADEGGLMKEA